MMRIYTVRCGKVVALLVIIVFGISAVALSRWNFGIGYKRQEESFDPMTVRFVEVPAPAGVTATQSPWQGAATDPRPVVLATTNKAYLDLTANMLASIQRIATNPKVLVVAEDSETLRFLYGRPGVHVAASRGYETPAHNVLPKDSEMFNATVNKRPAYIYQLLQEGHAVLSSDVDTVWLEDPFQHLEGDFDIALERDQFKPHVVYSSGFVLFKATEKAKQFVKMWLRRLQSSKTSISDQELMNQMLMPGEGIPGLRKRVLPSEIFPNGKLFFLTPEWRRLHRHSVAVVHNNLANSKEDKIQRFQDQGLWFVEESP